MGIEYGYSVTALGYPVISSMVFGPWGAGFSKTVAHLSNSSNIGRRALFSYRTCYDVIEFSNCDTEKRSEAEFFCAG